MSVGNKPCYCKFKKQLLWRVRVILAMVFAKCCLERSETDRVARRNQHQKQNSAKIKIAWARKSKINLTPVAKFTA